MKKILVIPLVFSLCVVLGAQQKNALVIGNSNYRGISSLKNPENDATDMETALTSLGFDVDIVLNGSSEQMEAAIINLRRNLSVSRNSYGFFYYAGHGVQAAGENYLIPVNAETIVDEITLRYRAIPLQFVLDNLNDAENELNMIVLDACRDNPFGWNRSGIRGFTVVSSAPRGSIIFYATSGGRPAADGTGRNGLFTGHLLNYIRTPGLEVSQIFRLTGDAVTQASGGSQIPAIYDQYFRSAYLDSSSSPGPILSLGSSPAPSPAPFLRSSLPPVNAAKEYYDRGVDYFDKGEYELAIMAFDEAIKLDNEYSLAYSYRARAYTIEGNNDQSIADSNQAIFLDLTNWMGFLARGTAYRNKYDYDRAIADYTQTIKLNPEYAPAYYERGLVYRYKRDYDRAIEDYTLAIAIDPNYKEAYNHRGIVYSSNKNDYDRAIEDFTRAIGIDPNYATALNNRGVAYERKRDVDRARADYEAALRIDPNDTAAGRNLRGLR